MTQINHTYRPADEESFIAVPVSAEVVAETRGAAVQFLKDNTEEGLAMRTCWECNSAHIHLIEKTNDFVLNCFGCGKWFFQQTDITTYEESEDAEEE